MTPGDGDVEQCLDVLNDLINELPYGLSVMAVALRVHLEALLQALLAGELCTREEVRAFLKDLERDALQYEESGES
jgi:hypothetical protein